MVNRSDAPDLAVDELKRRARRRLVGAIVLALAAAVLLPLLLESEPKPLGDEVSIQIPPIDNSKFVTPLSPGKATEAKGARNGTTGKSAPVAEAPPAPAAAAPSNAPQAPTTVAAGSEQKSEGDEKSAAATGPPTAATLPAPPPAATPQKEAPAPAPVEARAAPRPAAPGDAAPSAAPFALQVAAFTDRYGAQALARKLKQAGFPAYVEPVASDKGELQRVRVGPYATRETADAARAKLKTAGYSAIVTRTR